MQTATVKHHQELYGRSYTYAIEVFVNPLTDGSFAMSGWIRHAITNRNVQHDLPFEYPFVGQMGKYKSADDAITEGLSFARGKIDSLT